ncbi:hypothetical protein NIES3787_41130 [Microcystis aeruginosa NIES-3787]|uniref:Uncharacterized protein n=1 Tax=Microcystis aeruginosa NIES-3787 TaxID=2517782 RepID=A0A6H9GE78_MICAE|nr:hypothetical protein NIES3787_41130 [Microcystis aeruginosa NIES-3787]
MDTQESERIQLLLRTIRKELIWLSFGGMTIQVMLYFTLIEYLSNILK